ncbi:MAG: c-type cytochrome [Candidatus Acidiferrales bacterium]
MTKCPRLTLAIAVAILAMTGACRPSPARKKSMVDVARPEQTANFQRLYAANCAACHGENGQGSVAVALASPVYVEIADDDVIRKVIADGGPGKLSPAFSRSMGGLLTDQQIAALVDGIRRWSKPEEFAGMQVPPRAENAPGNAQRGAVAFRMFCSSCHGLTGNGGKTPGSIVDPSLLALLSNQDLRTLVIVGLPQFGAPDWRDDVPGHPMTDRQISDVVAWLASHRVQFPGQPYLQESQTQEGSSE